MHMKVSEYIAVVSVMGIAAWIVSGYYGGMFIYLLSYWIVIIPIVIAYIWSLLHTGRIILSSHRTVSKITALAHWLLIIVVLAQFIQSSELFKSKRVISAELKGDLYTYELVFRENGSVENNIAGIFGYSETLKGSYSLEDSLIIFGQKPYDNNFLPDTLYLDREQSAIFLTKNQEGVFEREKGWLNHFNIK